MKKIIVAVGIVAAASLGCSKLKEVTKVPSILSQDIALEDQAMLLDKYTDRNAWTRTTIEDMKEREVPGEPKKRVIPRDTKVMIFDLTFSYNGAVTIKDKKKRKITYPLEIERPLTVEKIDARMDEIFWFKDPVMRHVEYIRKWDKRTARAVRNHEVFIGMPADAAMESWGKPTQIRRNEVGGQVEEQWAYKRGKRPKYIYILAGTVSKYDE